MPHSTPLETAGLPPTSLQPVDELSPDTSSKESPTAPEYSPITPKVRPALPVTSPTIATTSFVPPDHGGGFTFSMSEHQHQTPHAPQQPHPSSQSTPFSPVGPPPPQQHQHPTNSNDQPDMKASQGVYIPQPPNLPFSSDDASDAIALRAAISTLQFQRRKAQDDLKALARIKALALEDPHRFKAELASGNLKEKRLTMGDLQAILDQSDSDDEDEGTETDRRDRGESGNLSESPTKTGTEMEGVLSSSQPGSERQSTTAHPPPFPSIPGPQTVVRMPYVNWEKYGIVGEPLETMHAQQQRWPGSTGSDRGGREYTPAAPYSPFLDHLDGSSKLDGDAGLRKDSAAEATAGAASPTGTVRERMETRRRA